MNRTVLVCPVCQEVQYNRIPEDVWADLCEDEIRDFGVKAGA